MKIAIIGGGFMGLVLAHEITKTNAEVKVFESGAQLGGLTTYHDYGSFVWDKFYHVITPTDSDLIEFIDELGLGDKICWRRSLTGYYSKRKFYSLSSSKEFLMFPLLGIIDKIRLGYTLFYGSKINDWKKLEKIPVKDWLIKLGGKRTYEKFWAPMLYAKLGENRKKVSAVFIWTYIKRLFKARSSAAQKEHMAYVTGGYKTVFDRIEASLTAAGSQVLKESAIDEIVPDLSGGIRLTYNGKQEHFEKVVFTGPLNILEKVTSPDLFSISKSAQPIDYLGVICLIVVTTKPISPYYVLNIGDTDTPFTGVIGMSSVVDLDQTAGKYITYFPKYISADHDYWSKTDEELKNIFLKGVSDLYPEFDMSNLESTHVNRAFKVQPMQVLNYSEIIPKIHTKHPDFYVLNTSQFVNESVNNNSVIGHVNRFMVDFKNDLKAL